MHKSWWLAGLLAAACSDDAALTDDSSDDEVRDARVGDAAPMDSSMRALDATTPGDASAPADAQRTDASVVTGTPLRVITYNVAGLPEGISSSNPERNSALISPLLNGYDLALLQEDFTYHPQIIGMAMQPYKSPSDMSGNSLGDGLNFLSNFPFSDLERVPWDKCNGVFDQGSDCLTPKGFSYARIDVAGSSIDIYDLHTDAGSSAADQSARSDNLRQLASAIQMRSAGRAVIVAGDTNARYSRAGDTLPDLLDGAGLSDVWVQLVRSGARPAAGSMVTCSATDLDDPACDRIDKIFYRNGGGVTLRPSEYRVEGAKFQDSTGVQLSDHRPVSVLFTVSPG